MEVNKIYNGDCLEVMRGFQDSSIDTIITDPPYGYSFMGKDWDKAVPSVEVWKECLRVLKDGAFLMVMSAPRQDVLSQMIVRIGQAGFDISKTSIYWAYASGFPKASNIGKMVDKRLGNKREVIGKRITGKAHTREEKRNANEGFESGQMEIEETKGTSELEGSYGGFQPKPAVEVIIVAMKPLSEKTYVDQAMKNRKGITWLDDCRIPYESEDIESRKQRDGKNFTKGKYNIKILGQKIGNKPNTFAQANKGRFPANLLVSDDVLNDGRITKSGSGAIRKNTKQDGSVGFMAGTQEGMKMKEYADSGSFSRYFDLDKWWAKTFPFLIVPKASKSEKNKGLEGTMSLEPFEKKKKWNKGGGGTGISDRENIMTRNVHPTVKPIKLMSYLIMLSSREGDIVLDPFVGSGTTAIAAKQLKRDYIGIDLSQEYCDIAEARLKSIQQTLL